ncbi:MAG: sulfatase-like hydrolase/transferase, partial [Pseudomonadota bacterium]
QNLLVILSDEHQARAMGCAGHPFVETPHLDALAARGTRYTNCVTPSPICVPARAAFATGRYPHQTGHWDNAMPYTGTPESWGHVLQRSGVDCASIGKLHYRKTDDETGFDEEILPMHVVGGVGMVWASIRREAERVSPKKRMLGDEIGPGHSTYTNYETSVTQAACDWIAQRGAAASEEESKPFCLYVGLVAPHFPLVVPEAFYNRYAGRDLGPIKLRPEDGYRRHPWVEKQNALMDSDAHFRDPAERHAARAAYYGLCSFMDANIGRILTALTDAGLSGTTSVIYASDHGDNLGARGLWGKSSFYEESVAVPLIMAHPGAEAEVCDTPVSLVDVAATIPDHFGLGGLGVGAPLASLSHGPADRPQFAEYHAAGAVSGGFMVRCGRWKLIYYVDFPPELYDLESDPEECDDRAADPACADVRAGLEVQLRRICDPETVSAQAFADQDALIARLGGRDAALKLGAPGATPPPTAQS